MNSTATVRERWGEQLRLARLKLRLSQDEVAEATSLTGATISRAESGSRGSLDVYHRLAAYLGVTLEAGDQS